MSLKFNLFHNEKTTCKKHTRHLVSMPTPALSTLLWSILLKGMFSDCHQLKGQCYDSGLISTDDNLLGKEYCVHVWFLSTLWQRITIC